MVCFPQRLTSIQLKSYQDLFKKINQLWWHPSNSIDPSTSTISRASSQLEMCSGQDIQCCLGSFSLFIVITYLTRPGCAAQREYHSGWRSENINSHLTWISKYITALKMKFHLTNIFSSILRRDVCDAESVDSTVMSLHTDPGVSRQDQVTRGQHVIPPPPHQPPVPQVLHPALQHRGLSHCLAQPHRFWCDGGGQSWVVRGARNIWNNIQILEKHFQE